MRVGSEQPLMSGLEQTLAAAELVSMQRLASVPTRAQGSPRARTWMRALLLGAVVLELAPQLA
jgi:hypothetical protein